jgi:hypothetical protein
MEKRKRKKEKRTNAPVLWLGLHRSNVEWKRKKDEKKK